MMNLMSDFPMITADLTADIKAYAAICDNRSRMKCHTYKINDYTTLDFWGKNEWEFTFTASPKDPNAEKHHCSMLEMSAYLNRNNPTLSRLPRLVSYCKLIAERAC